MCCPGLSGRDGGMAFLTPERRRVCALFALAALPRVVYLFAARPAFEGYHWTISSFLLQDGVIGDENGQSSEFDPLYIALLAAARIVTGDRPIMIQLLQIGADAFAAVQLSSLTLTLTGRRRAALISGVLYAAYPLLIRYSVACSEFTLLSLLLVTFCRAFLEPGTPSRTAAAGVWLGLACLTRSAIAPLAALAILHAGFKRGATTAGVLLLAGAGVVSPWLARNQTFNGSWWPTRSGVNLFLGNSPYTADLLPEHNIDILGEYAFEVVARERPDLVRPGAEVALDRYYTRLAWDTVSARPMDAVALAISKAAYYFWPRLVPSRVRASDTSVALLDDGRLSVRNSRPRPLYEEVAYTVPYVLVAGAALFGIWIRLARGAHDVVLWYVVAASLASAMVYYPETRFRVSMEFVLLFYAAVAVDRAFRKAA